MAHRAQRPTRDRNTLGPTPDDLRILLYGFGPYRHYRQNITAKILRKVPRRRWLAKMVFPVKFDRRQFLNALKAHQPDVILGLGQCSTGGFLRIENRAVNRRRNDIKQKAKPIALGGARTLSTTLELKLGRHARASTRAGEYVCNYSMYVLLDFLKRYQLPARFGFVHVPHDYDPTKAAELLAKRILGLKSTAARRQHPSDSRKAAKQP